MNDIYDFVCLGILSILITVLSSHAFIRWLSFW